MKLDPSGTVSCLIIWVLGIFVYKTAVNLLSCNILYDDQRQPENVDGPQMADGGSEKYDCVGIVLETHHIYGRNFGNYQLNFGAAGLFNEYGFLGTFLLLFIELGLFAHFVTAITDPGCTSSATENPPPNFEGKATFCTKCCGRWKPPRVHHCRVCDRCVFKMDHHCCWVRNCIGQMNQKCFILFLSYMGSACVLNIIIIFYGLYRFLRLSSEKQLELSTSEGWFFLSANVQAVIWSTIISIITLRIISVYLLEQWEAVITNVTLVETYRGTRGPMREMRYNMESVFGANCFLWFIPLPLGISIDWTEPEFRCAT